VVPHSGGITTTPRIAKGADGRFFFATFDSIAVVDPAHISEQAFVPPIVIEEVLVNRKPVEQGAPARFVEPEDVQFEYTSLSLRNPENVRFRYRLEGYDKDWVEAGAQRRAMYGSLKPGSYRFQVIGSGGEGLWNNVGASYGFQIAAPFYKTPLFLLAMAATFATLLLLTYRYRLGLEAKRIRMRMEVQAEERLHCPGDARPGLMMADQFGLGTSLHLSPNA
jgi:hypothetical protein